MIILASNMLQVEFGLGQGLANYNLQTNSSPMPVFLNEVLLEYSHACFFPYLYGCFWLVAKKRTYGSQGLTYLLSGHLQKTLAHP